MPMTSFLKTACLMIVLAGVLPATAQPVGSTEHAHLALLIRQLDMLDRTANESRALSQSELNRFYLDYPSLHADIDLIRSGIREYLSPQRAQPRDPVELSGRYIQDGSDDGQPQQ